MLCFFFNDTATTEIYTLSLHDALPICKATIHFAGNDFFVGVTPSGHAQTIESDSHRGSAANRFRSEEHTSELQSQSNLVCRLLLEKNNTDTMTNRTADPTDPSSAH